MTEKEPKYEFHLMSYEHDMTEFVDISVNSDGVVAIDDFGEIWILCGLNRYYYKNLGLKKSSHIISRPICTNYMAKAGFKATKIRLGNQCIMVDTIN